MQKNRTDVVSPVLYINLSKPVLVVVNKRQIERGIPGAIGCSSQYQCIYLTGHKLLIAQCFALGYFFRVLGYNIESSCINLDLFCGFIINYFRIDNTVADVHGLIQCIGAQINKPDLCRTRCRCCQVVKNHE